MTSDERDAEPDDQALKDLAASERELRAAMEATGTTSIRVCRQPRLSPRTQAAQNRALVKLIRDIEDDGEQDS
jgi:LmbE family N-acetylglucosaminyl deacetylase